MMVLVLVAASPWAAAQTTVDANWVAITFKANCAICHAEDFAGTALGNRLHVKDLRTQEVQERSPKELAQTIKVGKDNMPAFGDRLDSDQIQRLVEYIRHKAPAAH